MSNIIDKAKDVRAILSNIEKMDEMGERLEKFAMSYPKSHVVLKCVNPNEDIDITNDYEVTCEDLKAVMESKKDAYVESLKELIKEEEQAAEAPGA
ncbi:hypothetical protein EAL2_c16720 [Peptoclostridium acidaminophilum DSM 3953]|uniref:Uncharacterized protein n=1 Tax=Peptoclostridium acidaminophilum DSM 3953 TaxID=1286171 RepID=W8TL88_PEPAC|nr:hypothetical protein [Peptoclostridium acidaminophilum]AHM56967.1 hypothetical protein EAL2_c16720 [Peptoclostridium acidaminophilum DSM 3953]